MFIVEQKRCLRQTASVIVQTALFSTMPQTFSPVSERPIFPKEEERILEYWKKVDAFKASYQKSKDEKRPLYTFYDGPPFATGLPHYGHILAGTMKDIVTRHAHQSGFCVERRFGWDCHGLPVEFEIDKELNVTSRKDIVNKIGIAAYNEKCRSIVMRYAGEWRKVVERVGRWIDFDNDYKTLEKSFMESVWWVFKSLFDKGLVYRAFKVMPYSTSCTTPLSNFEANQNYKDVKDPSIVVTFPAADDETLEYLAWTTTPWTLPSNMAVCVNPQLNYVRLRRPKDNSGEAKKDWICCESRVEWLLNQLKLEMNKDIEIVGSSFKGSTLTGRRYIPLFDSPPIKPESKMHQVVADAYVADDVGTGCVHCAPAFGEDDYRVCVNFGIIEKEGKLFCPVDDDGLFTSEVEQFKGMYVKDADQKIKECLKKKGRLLINGEFVHAYPHCWRSDKPLIYKAVPSWFVRVEQLQERLVSCNEKTYWVPPSVKEKRFHNWLCEARDWCISRNRFWGTPIPLWTSSDFTQIVCIGSIAELEKHCNRELQDIHRHFIDEITIPDPRGSEFPPLQRIPEVFDCWFESGAMPYAQIHYPFENTETFSKGFPADFIGEGLDQTRGWFYTLMVISTALFDQPPFKNLIATGLVLAADGRKMSKRLKNYPDPMEVVNSHGADALRLFLINSPVVKAESLKFRMEGVKDVVRDVLLPWYHAYRFFIQETSRYESVEVFRPDLNLIHTSDNKMDRWIYASTQSLVNFSQNEMAAYRLYTVIPKLVNFLNQLTNWYVRLNRCRMRGQSGQQESLTSLSVLFEVLFTIVRLMSPFTPFITELFYENLKAVFPDGHEHKQPTVHDVMMPKPNLDFVDEEIERLVAAMQDVIIMGRTLRERKKLSLKTPLKEVTVVCPSQQLQDQLIDLCPYIKEELNVLECNLTADASLVELTGVPNFRALGARLGKDMPKVSQAIKELGAQQLKEFEKTGSITVEGYLLEANDLTVQRQQPANQATPDVVVDAVGDLVVMLNIVEDPELQKMAVARETVNRVQKMRKALSLKQDDPVVMFMSSKSEALRKTLCEQENYITRCLRRQIHIYNNEEELVTSTNNSNILNRQIFDLNDDQIEIVFASASTVSQTC